MVDKDSNCIVIESDSDDDVEFVAETKTNSVTGAVITPVKLSTLQMPYFQKVSQVRDLFSNVQTQAQPVLTPVLIRRPENEPPITGLIEEHAELPPHFVQRPTESTGNVTEPNSLIVKSKKRNVCRKSTSRGQTFKQKSLLKPSCPGSLNTIECPTINSWDGPKLGVAFSLGTTGCPDVTSSSSPDISSLQSGSFDLKSAAFLGQTSNECNPISSKNILMCSETVVDPQLAHKPGEINDAPNDSKPSSSSLHIPKPESSIKSTSLTPTTSLVESVQKPRSNNNVKPLARTGLEKKFKKVRAKEKLRNDAALVVFELKRLLPGGEASEWSLGECLQTANTFIPNLCNTDHLLKIKYLKQVDQNICKSYEIDRLLCELREMSNKEDKQCEQVNQSNLESNQSVEESEQQCEPSTSLDTKSYQSDYYKIDQMAFSFHNYWDKLHQYDTFLSHLDACVKGDKPNSTLDVAESNYRAYSEQFSTTPEPLLEEIDLKEKLESLKTKLDNKRLMDEGESNYSLEVKIFDSKDEEDLITYEDKGELEEFKTGAANVDAGTNDEHIKLVISSFRTLETFNFDSEDENYGEEGLPNEECSIPLRPSSQELINEPNSTSKSYIISISESEAVNSGVLPLDLSSKEKIEEDFHNDVHFEQTKVLDSEISVVHKVEKIFTGINYTLQGPDDSNENWGVKNLGKEEASKTRDGAKIDGDEQGMKTCKPVGSNDVSSVDEKIVNSTEVDLSSNCYSGIKTVDALGNYPSTCLQSVNITDKSDGKLPTTSDQEDSDSSVTSDEGNKTTTQEQTPVKNEKKPLLLRRSVRLTKTETNDGVNSPVKEHTSNKIDDECKENNALPIKQQQEDKSSDVNKTAMTSSTNINVDSFTSQKKASKASEINTKSPNFKSESNPKKHIESSNQQKVDQLQKKRKSTDSISKPAIKKIILENCPDTNCNKNISRKKTAVLSKKDNAIKNVHLISEEKNEKSTINKQIVRDNNDLQEKRTVSEEGNYEAIEENTSEAQQVKSRTDQPNKCSLDKKSVEDGSALSDKEPSPKKKFSQLDLTKLKVERALKTLRFKKISKSTQPDDSKKSQTPATDSQNKESQQTPRQAKIIPKGVLKTSNKTPLDGTRYASQVKPALSHEKQVIQSDKEKVTVINCTTNKGVRPSESSHSPQSRNDISRGLQSTNSPSNTYQSLHNSKRDFQKVYADQNTSGRRSLEERPKSDWPNQSLQERKDGMPSERKRDSIDKSGWHNRDPRKRGLLDTPPRKASRYSSEGDSELPRQRTTEPRLIDELMRSRQSEGCQQKEIRNHEFRPNETDSTRSRNQRAGSRWQENYADQSVRNSPTEYSRYESNRNEYQSNRSIGTTNWDDYNENRLSQSPQYEGYRYSEGRQNYQSNRSGAGKWDNQRTRDRYQARTQNLNHSWRYSEENALNTWQGQQAHNRDSSMLSRVRQNMNR